MEVGAPTYFWKVIGKVMELSQGHREWEGCLGESIHLIQHRNQGPFSSGLVNHFRPKTDEEKMLALRLTLASRFGKKHIFSVFTMIQAAPLISIAPSGFMKSI